MGAYKNKVLDELYENGYRDLYNLVDQIESDVDVANYLNAARSYFTKTMSSKDLEGMPAVSQSLFGQLKTGTVDIDKEFGKDFYKHIEDIPYQHIKFVADKQGVDFAKLNKTLHDEALKRQRYDIAHGDAPDSGIMDKIGAGAMSLFGRRQQEAIERGEEPSWEDIGLDVAEQGLYFLPYGKALGTLSKGGKIGRILTNRGTQAAVSTTTAPLLTETADAVLYDEGPRSEFNISDVASGTAVNATAPLLVKGLAMGAGKLTNGKYTKAVMDYGQGKTTKELASEAHTPVKNYKIKNADNPAVPVGVRREAQRLKTLSSTDPEQYQLVTSGTLYEISKQPGKSFEEKVSNYIKSRGGNPEYTYISPAGNEASAESATALSDMLTQVGESVPSDLRMAALAEEGILKTEPIKGPYIDYKLLNTYDASPYTVAEEGLPLKTIAGQEAAINYLTNQVGNVGYEDADPYLRIPVVGSYISKVLKERAKEAEQKALEEQILNELKAKYQMPGDK